MAKQPNKEERVFRVAFGIESPELREEYLQQVCADDASLCDRIRALLAFNEDAPDFLEPPVNEIAATTGSVTIAERPGTQIGRYKLVHEIGQGGMGVVYMAVQREPVKRKVALKIIKPGMDTREVVARFGAERQALALMDHACIAKVLDGGSTESGRPFFVMELVEGTPIAEYCDACRYTTRQRLELFVQVCQAVQHAHQKGIIHRDIKPSNILVTTNGEEAVPKVIDFGIAKATQQQLTDQSLYTNLDQMIGTPLYMSPEQAQRTGLDVDTRTDVYSLGVLLYELLTGATPFEKERLRSSSLEEVKRIIREEEPPRPSTRLTTLDAALDTVVENHDTDLRTLARQLRGELDWIVMKAMEKDRSRRYESAGDFAKDVQRHLDGEAVAACPPSRIYRFRKMVRKNGAVLAVVSAVMLALILGLAGTSWQAAVAGNEREAAEEQRQIAQQNFERARDAVDQYLTRVSEDELLNTPGLKPLRKDLLELALEYYQAFVAERKNDPLLQAELAAAYVRVGSINGQIGTAEDALAAYREALNIRKQLAAEHPGEPAFLLPLALSHRDVAKWLEKCREPHAIASYRTATELLERLVEESPDNIGYLLALGQTYNSLGSALKASGSRTESLVIYQKASDISKKIAAVNPNDAEFGSLLASVHANIAGLYRDAGNLTEALESLRIAQRTCEAIDARTPEVPGNRDRMIQVYMNMGILAQERGDDAEALALFKKAVEINSRLASENPSVVKFQEYGARMATTMASLLMRSGNTDASLEQHQSALQIFTRLASEHPRVPMYREQSAESLNKIALIHMSREEWDAAEESYKQAIEVLGKLVVDELCVPDTLYTLAGVHHNFGNLLWENAQYDAAVKHYSKAIVVSAELVEKHPAVSRYRDYLANHCLSLGDLQRARGLLSESLASLSKALALREQLAEANPTVAEYQLSLSSVLDSIGALHLDRELPTEAIDCMKRASEIARRLAEEHPDNLHYQDSLAGRCFNLASRLSSVGSVQEAIASYEEAIAIRRALASKGYDTSLNSHRLAGALNNLANLQMNTGATEDAKQSYQKAIAISEKLVREHPSVRSYKSFLINHYAGLSGLHRYTGSLSDAMAVRKKSLAICRQLAQRAPAVANAELSLALTHEAIGDLASELGLMEESLADFQHATDILEKLVSADPHVAEYRRRLVQCHSDFGRLRERMGELDSAVANHRKAIELAEKLISEHPNNPANQHFMISSLMCLGRIQHQLGKSQDARKHLAAAIELLETLGDQYPHIPDYPTNLATACMELGVIQCDENELDQAAESFKVAEQLLDRFLDHQAVCRQGQRLARVYLNVGDLQQELGELENSVQSYRNAAKLWAAIPEDGRTVDDWCGLGMSLYRSGQFRNAEVALQRAIDMRTEAQPTLAGGPRWWFRTMALSQLGEKDKARGDYGRLVQQLNGHPELKKQYEPLQQETAGLLANESHTESEVDADSRR